MGRRRTALAAVAALLLLPLLAACGSDKKPAAKAAGATTKSSPPTDIRLGYFPNITHASAIIGVNKGIFQKDLGQDTLKTTTFNAGPAAVEALFSGALDASF